MYKRQEQAKRDIRNMMNRVKRMRSRRGLPALRYIYITERTEKMCIRDSLWIEQWKWLFHEICLEQPRKRRHSFQKEDG